MAAGSWVYWIERWRLLRLDENKADNNRVQRYVPAMVIRIKAMMLI
jgi:hypothetical protein